MATSVTSKTWAIAATLAVVGGVWFLLPQLGVVIFSLLMAYLFYPFFTRIRRKKGGLAAVATLLLSFLVVLIPLAIIVVAAVGQLVNAADTLGRINAWQNVPEASRYVLSVVNDIAAPITGNGQSVTEQNVTDFLRTAVPAMARASVSLVLGIAGSLPSLAIAFIIYIFLFTESLLHGPQLIRRLYAISPLGDSATKRYLERIGLMANAMVKGQLIISLIISFLSALLLVPLGFGQYFFILFIVFTILNFVPLGCGVLMFPIIFYAMFTGQFWPGLIVFVLYYLTSNLDAILRPYFVPKSIQLSMGLTMVATFCGIAYFGILGVVYGPIVMIILVTTFDMYGEQRAHATNKPRH